MTQPRNVAHTHAREGAQGTSDESTASLYTRVSTYVARVGWVFPHTTRLGKDQWLLLWLIATGIFVLTGVLRFLSLMWLGDGTSWELLSRWDGKHYIRIADVGYFTKDGSGTPDPEIYRIRLAFFPGLPALMRLGHAIGLSYTLAGVMVASIFGVAMTAAIMAIVARLGASTRGQIAAALLVLGAPLSVTFIMVYTEAPFLALSLWACYWMMSRKWWHTAGFVSVAGVFRLTTIDLWLAFGIVVAFTAWRNWQAWVAWLISLVLLAGYLAYASSYTRDIGGYFGLQARGWRSSFDFGYSSVKWTVRYLHSSGQFGVMVAIGAMVAALVVCVLTFGRTPWPLWLFGAGVAANILLSGGIMTSRPRLLLPVLAALLPAAARWAEQTSRRNLLVLATVWVLFGAFISAHMLAVFKYAI